MTSRIYTEWRVTGDPGPGYDRPYEFTWGDRYAQGNRIPLEEMEQRARAFAAGEFLTDVKLAFRTVVETDWEEVAQGAHGALHLSDQPPSEGDHDEDQAAQADQAPAQSGTAALAAGDPPVRRDPVHRPSPQDRQGGRDA